MAKRRVPHKPQPSAERDSRRNRASLQASFVRRDHQPPRRIRTYMDNTLPPLIDRMVRHQLASAKTSSRPNQQPPTDRKVSDWVSVWTPRPVLQVCRMNPTCTTEMTNSLVADYRTHGAAVEEVKKVAEIPSGGKVPPGFQERRSTAVVL